VSGTAKSLQLRTRGSSRGGLIIVCRRRLQTTSLCGLQCVRERERTRHVHRAKRDGSNAHDRGPRHHGYRKQVHGWCHGEGYGNSKPRREEQTGVTPSLI
jgi:hypothetical protein